MRVLSVARQMCTLPTTWDKVFLYFYHQTRGKNEVRTADPLVGFSSYSSSVRFEAVSKIWEGVSFDGTPRQFVLQQGAGKCCQPTRIYLQLITATTPVSYRCVTFVTRSGRIQSSRVPGMLWSRSDLPESIEGVSVDGTPQTFRMPHLELITATPVNLPLLYRYPYCLP